MARGPVILVTGVGGNVAQGALRVLRSLDLDARVIGTNVDAVSAGNHLCDSVHVVPYADEEGYLDRIREICAQEGVGLVIPTTDYESYHLAIGAGSLPPVAASPAPVCETFLDKHLTAERFAAADVPFAESMLASRYDDRFKTSVTKPRKGRGSREVTVDHPDPRSLGSDYVVQRRYEGDEITTGFYVTRRGMLHGFIALSRTLEHGATSTCAVTHVYDEAIARLLRSMTEAFVIRGSCNVQCIATADGRVVPFEVNGRVSGTCAIRHQFGFGDVQYLVEEYLLRREPSPPEPITGCAVRMLVDVVYPAATFADVADGRASAVVF